MDEQELTQKIRRRSKTDEGFRQCTYFVDLHEAEYEAIRDTLTVEQQLQLDDYIAACENLEHAKLFIAYQIGLEQGNITAGFPGKQMES